MLTRGIYHQCLREPPPPATYLCVERFRLDVSESDQQLIDAGVGQPDWWRPAVEVRLQHGVNGDRCRAARLVAPRSGGTSTTRRQPRQVYGSQTGGAPQWRYVYNTTSTETGVGQPDWWRPAVEVRLQHGVNGDRCTAARLVAPRSGGTSTTRRQPRQVYGSQTGGAPQWRYVYNTASTKTGVGQPDWWRPTVEVRLQHGVNGDRCRAARLVAPRSGGTSTTRRQPRQVYGSQTGGAPQWRYVYNTTSTETGVRQPDWWRPAVEVRLQHGVNQDRCRAARLVAPRSGGTSTTRRQPRQVYGSQTGGAPQWRYVYNTASTETGVRQPDWWRPAVEVRLQRGVNQDRCSATNRNIWIWRSINKMIIIIIIALAVAVACTCKPKYSLPFPRTASM